MSRLAELIKQLCPDGVEYKPLSRCVVLPSIPRGLKRSQYESSGFFPIVDQGKEQIAGYTCDETKLVRDVPGIVFGDHTREIKYVDYFFVPGADGVKWIRAVDGIGIRYLFHCLLSLSIPSRGYNRHWNLVREMRIPVPPLEVQREIVRILDQFTTLEAELEAELEARRTQYEHYRNHLLSYESLAAHGRMEWCALDDLGTFVRGGGLQKADFVEQGKPCIHYGQIHTIFGVSTDSVVSSVSEEQFLRLKHASSGDLLIATTSEDDEAVAKATAWLGDEPVAISGDMFLFRHSLDPRYVSHFFASQHFQEQKRPFLTGAKVRRISEKGLKRILIPVPSREEQRRIVDLLDRFDALVNDITSGLPAEIAARRAQYKHYRDRLLSFPEKAAFGDDAS